MHVIRGISRAPTGGARGDLSTGAEVPDSGAALLGSDGPRIKPVQIVGRMRHPVAKLGFCNALRWGERPGCGHCEILVAATEP